MGLLTHKELLELHAAAVLSRLTESRHALLAGLDESFVSNLAREQIPSSQLLQDLNALNAGGVLPDGSVPLSIWLMNAIARTSTRKESGVFQAALHRIMRETGVQSAGPTQSNIDEEAGNRAASRPICKAVEELEELLVTRERNSGSTQELNVQTERINDLVRAITSAPRPVRGDIVADTELVRPIGSGNFATIWESRNLVTGKASATKIFHVEKLSQGVMLWRFRRSIRAMQLLTEHHDAPPNIVRIQSVACDTLSFSMDYLSGGDLERVAQRGWKLDRKIEILLDVCRAVAFAHRLGIIHRDIKPSNIVLDQAGRPVLTDFDIADIRFVTRLSVAQGGLGTPVFAAPEQLEDADVATERADIYSLGRLLHYLLLERSPGYQVENDPSLENLSRFPSTLVSIVRKATQYQPGKRYAEIREMVAELDRYQTGTARFRAILGNARRWVRLHSLLLGVVLLVVGGVAGFAVYEHRVAVREHVFSQELADLSESLHAAESRLDSLHIRKENIDKKEMELVSQISSLAERMAAPNLSQDERALLETERKQLGFKLDALLTEKTAVNQDIERLRKQKNAADARAEALRRRFSAKTASSTIPSTTAGVPSPTASPVSTPNEMDILIGPPP